MIDCLQPLIPHLIVIQNKLDINFFWWWMWCSDNDVAPLGIQVQQRHKPNQGLRRGGSGRALTCRARLWFPRGRRCSDHFDITLIIILIPVNLCLVCPVPLWGTVSVPPCTKGNSNDAVRSSQKKFKCGNVLKVWRTQWGREGVWKEVGCRYAPVHYNVTIFSHYVQCPYPKNREEGMFFIYIFKHICIYMTCNVRHWLDPEVSGVDVAPRLRGPIHSSSRHACMHILHIYQGVFHKCYWIFY